MEIIGMINEVLNALIGFMNQGMEFVGMDFRLDFEFDLPGIIGMIIDAVSGLGINLPF